MRPFDIRRSTNPIQRVSRSASPPGTRLLLLTSLLTALLAVAAVLTIACSGNGDGSGAPDPPDGPAETVVPTGWAGAYLITLTTEGGGGATTEHDVVLLCPGKSFPDVFTAARVDAETGLPFDDVSCSGDWNGSSADVTCTSTIVTGGCIHTQTLRFVASRSGDDLSGTLSTTHEYGPAGGGSGPCPEGSTSSVSIAGERTNTDTPGCADFEETVLESWEGDWDVTLSTGTPCDDPPSSTTYSNPVTLCAGAEVVASLFGLDEDDGVESLGGMSETRIDVFFTFRPDDACEVIRSFALYATRSANAFSGSWVQTDYVVGGGAGCNPQIVCTSGTCDGARTSASASGCP